MATSTEHEHTIGSGVTQGELHDLLTFAMYAEDWRTKVAPRLLGRSVVRDRET